MEFSSSNKTLIFSFLFSYFALYILFLNIYFLLYFIVTKNNKLFTFSQNYTINSSMYVKFNPNVLQKLVFVCYFMLRHVSALTVGHLQGVQQVQFTYNFKETNDKIL
jgi:hypothetical protein